MSGSKIYFTNREVFQFHNDMSQSQGDRGVSLHLGSINWTRLEEVIGFLPLHTS